ncbi:hypothetical protein F5X97DRAFT_294252, partial [Nemania serpens]
MSGHQFNDHTIKQIFEVYDFIIDPANGSVPWVTDFPQHTKAKLADIIKVTPRPQRPETTTVRQTRRSLDIPTYPPTWRIDRWAFQNALSAVTRLLPPELSDLPSTSLDDHSPDTPQEPSVNHPPEQASSASAPNPTSVTQAQASLQGSSSIQESHIRQSEAYDPTSEDADALASLIPTLNLIDSHQAALRDIQQAALIDSQQAATQTLRLLDRQEVRGRLFTDTSTQTQQHIPSSTAPNPSNMGDAAPVEEQGVVNLLRDDGVQALMTKFGEFIDAIKDAKGGSSHHWKLSHVGFLNPHIQESFGYGDHVQVGADVHWRNVYLFEESVKEHAKDPTRRAIIQRDFPQLLRGSAQSWWAGEISAVTRELLLVDLNLALEKVVERFKPDTCDALNQLKSPSSIFSPQRILNAESVREWAGGIFRLAKAAGRTTEEQQMAEVYNLLYPSLRQLIARPTAIFKVEDFLVHLEEKTKAHKADLASKGGRPTLDSRPTISQMMAMPSYSPAAGFTPSPPAPIIPVQRQLPAPVAYAYTSEGQPVIEPSADDFDDQADDTYFNNGRQNRSFGDRRQFQGRPSFRGQYRGNSGFSPRGNNSYSPRRNYDTRGSYDPRRPRYGYRTSFGARGRSNRWAGRGQPRRWRRWVRTGNEGQQAYLETETYIASDDVELEDKEAKLRDEGYYMLEELTDEEEDDDTLANQHTSS